MNPLTNYFRSWLSFLRMDLGHEFFTQLAPPERIDDSDDTFFPQAMIFLSLTILTVLVTTESTSDVVSLPAIKNRTTLRVFALFISVVWISCSLSLTRWSFSVFLTLFFYVALLIAPFGWMSWAQELERHHTTITVGWRNWTYEIALTHTIPFWITTGIWAVFSGAGTWYIETGWKRFVTVAGTIWIVLTTLITFSDFTGVLSATNAIYNVQDIHILLDVRYVLGILFGLAVLGEAIIRAWKKGVPDVPDMPEVFFPESSGYYTYWARTMADYFFSAANMVLHLLYSLLNSAWYSICIPVGYFIQVGQMAIDVINEYIARPETLKWYATLVGTYLLFLIMTTVSLASAGVVHSYLQQPLTSEAFVQAIYLLLLLSAGSICVTGLTWLFEEERRNLSAEGPLATLMILLATFFVAGLFMYTIAQFRTLSINEFRRLGPYTVLIFILIGIGLSYRVYTEKIAGNSNGEVKGNEQKEDENKARATDEKSETTVTRDFDRDIDTDTLKEQLSSDNPDEE